jgi:hypothetical protein
MRVRARKDLFWSDGRKKHLHVKVGGLGTVNNFTKCGLIVDWDNGEHRQILISESENEIEKVEEPVASGAVAN